MTFGKPLIASVSQTRLGGDKRHATAFEQLEVMGSAGVDSRANDLASFKLHQLVELSGCGISACRCSSVSVFCGHSIDLLRESWGGNKFKVEQGCNQVESQSKTSAAIAIAFS